MLARRTASLVRRAGGVAAWQLSRAASSEGAAAFAFTEENFKNPQLPHGLEVLDVPLVLGTAESLKGFGKLIRCVECELSLLLVVQSVHAVQFGG
jgi:hypothetical protein